MSYNDLVTKGAAMFLKQLLQICVGNI